MVEYENVIWQKKQKLLHHDLEYVDFPDNNNLEIRISQSIVQVNIDRLALCFRHCVKPSLE
jgi:hypothetical protein